MKQAQNYNSRKSIEAQIEDQIRLLKVLIDQFEPCPCGTPANQNNAVAATFNARSDNGWTRYMADLPRRMGLQRLLEVQRRRLLGLRTVPAPEPA